MRRHGISSGSGEFIENVNTAVILLAFMFDGISEVKYPPEAGTLLQDIHYYRQASARGTLMREPDDDDFGRAPGEKCSQHVPKISHKEKHIFIL